MRNKRIQPSFGLYTSNNRFARILSTVVDAGIAPILFLPAAMPAPTPSRYQRAMSLAAAQAHVTSGGDPCTASTAWN